MKFEGIIHRLNLNLLH